MNFRILHSVFISFLMSSTLIYSAADQESRFVRHAADHVDKARFCEKREERKDFINEIIARKSELGIDRKFNFFDIGLSLEEHEILESLHIKTAIPLRMYGNPEHKEQAIALYLESLGNSVEHSTRAAAIIHRLITESFHASGSAAISVIIRPTEQTDKFDIPRWHIDGINDPMLQGMNMKIVCALKGPATLFSTIAGSVRDEFLDALYKRRDEIDVEHEQLELDKKALIQMNYNKSFDIEPRKKLAQLIAPDQIEQGATRQGALFLFGDHRLAAVHSEPAIEKDRLFIAIIPGTIEQIKYLQYAETGV